MSGIHEGAPMREVVHIDTQTGAHGGEAWMLTLSCGHLAFRTKRSIGLGNVFEPIERKLAPHRARCLHCKIAAEANAGDIPDEPLKRWVRMRLGDCTRKPCHWHGRTDSHGCMVSFSVSVDHVIPSGYTSSVERVSTRKHM